MSSFCIELKTLCTSCGNLLPINGMVEIVFCTKCNKENLITRENWISIINDNVNETVNLEEGEGQTTKLMTGQYQFDILYGKQKPRCNSCKTEIPNDKLQEVTGNIKYTCKKCGNEIYLRPATELLTSILPEAKLLVGENENMLMQLSGKSLKPDSSKPVIYSCPSCAGSLKIDGSSRLVICEFCQSNVYLPDDLWFLMHPVAIAERWFITMNEKAEMEILPTWYSLSDVVMDNLGNLYFATSGGSFDESLLIWSATPDLKKRWLKTGLKLDINNTRLAITKSGDLLVWNTAKRSLLILSGKDGTEIKKIKGEAPTKEMPYTFNLMGCETLISDSDDTILALVKNTFVRFNPDGTRAPLWGDKVGGGLFGMFSGSNKEVSIPEDEPEWAPYLYEIGSKPKSMNSFGTRINLGWDDYVYIIDTISTDAMLAKYTHDGKQLWKKSMIPIVYKECKAYTDAHGNVYVCGGDEKYKARLIRFSPDGNSMDILLKDITEGGTLKYNHGDRLLVSPEGVIYVINYDEKIRIYNPDLSLRYLSPTCIKEDKETIEKFNAESEDL